MSLKVPLFHCFLQSAIKEQRGESISLLYVGLIIIDIRNQQKYNHHTVFCQSAGPADSTVLFQAFFLVLLYPPLLLPLPLFPQAVFSIPFPPVICLIHLYFIIMGFFLYSVQNTHITVPIHFVLLIVLYIHFQKASSLLTEVYV